jgi:hypothetical protein
MNPSSTEIAIWFPQWAESLDRLPLPPARRQQYRVALLSYLRYCKQARQRATVASARQFMATAQARRTLEGPGQAVWKEALNWFFREGRKAGRTDAAPERPAGDEAASKNAVLPNPCQPSRLAPVPPPAAADLGQAPWERRLIEALRTRHYQWRTEQTYRGWATRFARWLTGRGRTVEAATAPDVRDFLTDLATRERVAAATQKQALNALVFGVVEG